MECGDYERVAASMARGPCGVGLQLNFRSRGGGAPARPVVLEPPAPRDSRLAAAALPPDVSDMDEISYWIHTKRAPCLMEYDNIVKRQKEQQPHRAKAPDADPTPKNKKSKRKLSLLDEDSVSTGKQQNLYFEVSQMNNRPLVNECKSDSFDSDLDFNIKNTSVGGKPKRVRLQKSARTLLHKKNKVVTSTPKTNTIVNLRRSLRQAQLNNSHLNSSYEILNSNGALTKHENTELTEKAQNTDILAIRDETSNKRQSSQRNKSKNATNGQYEDYSDVSGFTANYIRSTKVQAGKRGRKLRKPSRTLRKNLQDDNMVVCINKSVNTGLPEPNMLDCSTDSSQNVLNLVTSQNDSQNINKVDKSTSLLKFIDRKTKSKERKVNGKQKKSNLNISFQSQSSGTSRYPKRHRQQTGNTEIINTRSKKSCLELNNSDKKENPEEKVLLRTRSGRNAALASQLDHSVLVVSNSTEHNSCANINEVRSPSKQTKKRQVPTRRAKKSLNQSATKKNSSRHKSGFTACFSSDDDSVPLVQRKFFCN